MKLLGILYFILSVTAAFSCWIFLIPIVLTLPIHSNYLVLWRRKYVNFISGIFFDYSAFLLTKVCGTKIFIYTSSPEILNDVGCMVISNHRTRVDWMYIWCYAAISKLNPNMKFILKDSLKSVPIYGWCMQIMIFIFLSRKREQDIPNIIRAINYLLLSGTNPSLFLFPEGTDLSESNKVKSSAFAKSRGLPEYNYVLYPKPAGIATVVGCLRGRNLALHDITMAYVDYKEGERTSEKSLLSGCFPREIHMAVDRHMVDSLPGDTDPKHLTQWLYHSFARKERLLSAFYQHGSRVPSEDPDWPPLLRCPPPDPIRPVCLMGGMLAVSLLGLLLSTALRWGFTLYAALFILGAKCFGGFDSLEMGLHEGLFGGPLPEPPTDTQDTAFPLEVKGEGHENLTQ